MDIARRLLVGNMTARVRFESAEEARHFNPDSDPVLWLRDGSRSGSGRGEASMPKRAARRFDGRPASKRESIDRCQFQVSRGKKLGNRVSCYA